MECFVIKFKFTPAESEYWIFCSQVATLSSCCPRPPAPPPLSTGDHDSTQSRIISSEVQGSIEGKCKVIVDQEEIDWKW